MSKLIFVNLPVADLDRAVTFYEAVGAVKNEQFTDHTAACIRSGMKWVWTSKIPGRPRSVAKAGRSSSVRVRGEGIASLLGMQRSWLLS